MKLRDYDDIDVELEPTAFECTEDRDVFDLGRGEEWDEDETVCPYDARHYVGPLLVTTTVPAGVPADVARDHWHPTRKRYEFGLDPDS